MLTLTDKQVEELLSPSLLVAALEEAFRRDYRATVRMPNRLHLNIPATGVLLTMPCFDSALPALGIKLVVVRDPPPADGGAVEATYLLLDPATGEVRAHMAANSLTDLRTAAASAVATKRLARPDAATLGLFGTGRQAAAHLRVFSEVLNIRDVLVCGSRPERSREFARRFTAEIAKANAKIEPADPRACASRSDVLCTCTTSKEPLFEGSWLRPGTHLNLVGAFQPDTREADDETIRRARVVVDTYEGALAEAGDLLLPLNRGIISREHIAADLHELVSEKKPGRTTGDDITVFKSVGCALEDLVAAKHVYDAVCSSP